MEIPVMTWRVASIPPPSITVSLAPGFELENMLIDGSEKILTYMAVNVSRLIPLSLEVWAIKIRLFFPLTAETCFSVVLLIFQSAGNVTVKAISGL